MAQSRETCSQIYGRYPFDSKERDYARKFHAAEYPLPPEVPASDSVKDLLSKLLVADPSHRLGMAGIMAHPWFRDTLPTGALQMNTHYLTKAPRLSDEVCQYRRSRHVCGTPLVVSRCKSHQLPAAGFGC